MTFQIYWSSAVDWQWILPRWSISVILLESIAIPLQCPGQFHRSYCTPHFRFKWICSRPGFSGAVRMKAFAVKVDRIWVGQIQRLLAPWADSHLYAGFVRGILLRNDSIDSITLRAKQSGN